MILRPIFRLNLNIIRRSISRSKYPFPVLREEDLEENFVHGWGAGGSKVNKTKNCVCLKHLPTGVFVKVHDSRMLEENREIARERLVEKVDYHLNGENSYLAQKTQENVDKSSKSEQKRKKKREKSAEFRELFEKSNEEAAKLSKEPS